MSINLKQVLAILESGEFCSMEVLTANVNQGTGGKLLIIPKCKIARNQSTVSIGANAAKKVRLDGKNPNHRKNFTRNIETANGDIITIHPILIHKINNHFIL